MQNGIKQKFNENSQLIDRIDWNDSNGYVLYAVLKKEFNFLEPFSTAMGSMNFNNSETRVKCFGVDSSNNPIASKNVEILPLDFNEKEYLGINVITVLDAIDYEKSIYKTYRDGKRIMAFKKYVFLPTVIENVSMFKILDEKTRYAFVSDEFKQTVEKNNLLGFKFKLVWDSENE